MRTLLKVGLSLGFAAIMGLTARAAAPAPVSVGGGDDALFVATGDSASSRLTLGGSLFTRWDIRQNMTDYDSDVADHQDWIYSRIRLDLGFDLGSGGSVFIQPQAYYVWGGINGSNFAVNGYGAAGGWGLQGSSDRDELQIYQAYVTLNQNIGGFDTEISVGRMELAFGSEMLLGNASVGQGVSYDAVKVKLNPIAGLTTTVFAAKLVENDVLNSGIGSIVGADDFGWWGFNDTVNNDAHLFGVWNTMDVTNNVLVDAYIIYLNDQIEDSADVAFFGTEAEVKLWTLGARVKVDELMLVGQTFDASAELAVQFGEAFGGAIDISNAYGLEVEVGVTTSLPLNPRFAIGYAQASGDESDPFGNNTANNSFNPLMQDKVGRLGEADQMNLTNLRCIYVEASAEVLKDLTVKIAYFKFDAMSDGAEANDDLYGAGDWVDPTGTSGNDISQEVDLGVAYKISDNASFGVIWSIVQPEDLVNDDYGANSPAHRVKATLKVAF
jgi:Alginate export